MTTSEPPHVLVAGLQSILGLDEQSVTKLQEALREAEACMYSHQFVSRLSERIPQISKVELDSIFNLLGGFQKMREDMTADQAVHYLKATIEHIPAFASLEKSKFRTLSERIEKLVDASDSISLMMKANEVVNDCDHLFTECKILSDIRPVFSDVDAPPSAAAITHTLKLVFQENSKSKEFFTVLNDQDLLQLQKQVNRALKKDKSLRAVLNFARIPVLEGPEEDNERTS